MISAVVVETLSFFFIQLAIISILLGMCNRKKHKKILTNSQFQRPYHYSKPAPALDNAKQAEESPSPKIKRTTTIPNISMKTYNNNNPTEVTAREISNKVSSKIQRPIIDATQKKSIEAEKKEIGPSSLATALPPVSVKSLKLEPKVLHWKPDGGIQTVAIRNLSQDRHAVKVQCSDNQLYRVNPVYSFIEPGQSLDVDILRNSGPAKVDTMVFITSKASSKDYSPSAIVDSNSSNDTMVLPLIAQNV